MKNMTKYATMTAIVLTLVVIGCGGQAEPEPTPVPPTPTTVVQPPTPIPPTPVPTGPINYTIREGDTLMLLAFEFLGDGSRWTEIAAENPSMDPDNIYVGQEILIPRD